MSKDTGKSASVKKKMPTRTVKKNMLDPEWFVKTVSLALKHKSTIIFTGDTVWGVTQAEGENICVFYEGNAGWSKEIKRLYPKGAIFGCDTVSPQGNCFAKMLSYSKVPTDDKSKCYINAANGVVHIKGTGVILKNCGFFATDLPPPKLPDGDLVPFNYEDVVPKENHALLVSCINPNHTERKRTRCFLVDNVLYGTDGHTLTALAVEGAPTLFNFNHKNVDPYDIEEFLCAPKAGDVMSNVYRLHDGVLMCEVPAPETMKPVEYEQVVGGAVTAVQQGTVGGEFLRDTMAKINSMGLGKGEITSDILFNSGTMSLVTSEGVVAVFDGDVTVDDDVTVRLSSHVLLGIAKTGLDQGLNSLGPCLCQQEGVTFLAMPQLSISQAVAG